MVGGSGTLLHRRLLLILLIFLLLPLFLLHQLMLRLDSCPQNCPLY